MSVWAIADPHLSFGVSDKSMDVFGDQWKNHANNIESNWKKLIQQNDLVLIPGDISWAMTPEEARADLEWIHSLPGTKVMIRGNHDYWWTSLSKVEKVLPPSIHLIQNNLYTWEDVVIGGTRLWDTSEYNFKAYIDYKPNSRAKPLTEDSKNPEEDERIFVRELGRLEMSLQGFKKVHGKTRIAMTHYPPIGADLSDSRVSKILEKYEVSCCVFGHLHNVKQEIPMFGEKNGVSYRLTSCDYLNFIPVKIS